MKVGLLCGSLGDRSANAALLQVADTHLHQLGHDVVLLGDVATIPAFNPSLVDEPPAPVADIRRTIKDCDAVLIAAPEYAAGLAGATKNALDWLVGDATVYRKVMGVASAGTTGGRFAIEQLVRTISWQGGWVVATLGVSAPRAKSDEDGVYTDRATVEGIITWTEAVVGAVDGLPGHREALLAAVITPYGIDLARFGSIG